MRAACNGSGRPEAVVDEITKAATKNDVIFISSSSSSSSKLKVAAFMEIRDFIW